MAEKIVSQLDAEGFFVSPTAADESPLEPGKFIIPAGAVDVKPPIVPVGKRAKFNDGRFVMEDIPAAPAPTEEQIAEAVTRRRAAAYKSEADPLFFKSQRGEATLEEWVAKIAEIKARFPDGVMPA